MLNGIDSTREGMMRQGGIFLSFDEINADADLSAAVGRYAAKRLQLASPPVAADPDEEGLERLSIKDAQLFLNTCGDKTLKALDFIVGKDGRFTSDEIHRHMRSKDLRGVWTGLTRRLRNISKKDDAKLLNWFWRGTDWQVVMAAESVTSLRAALSQRA